MIFYFCCCSSVRSFLCTSTADLRVVYTPPLCLTPSTRHKEVVQATGHSLELNVITDATLFVGYDQVSINYITCVFIIPFYSASG